MNRIQEVLDRDDWVLKIEVDSNVGGDGPRVRLSGDTRSFRQMSAIMTAMADAVDSRQEHPAGQSGWFLMFGGEMPQFEFNGATFLSLHCAPSKSD